jgi:type I restriction enzyme, S subunit
MSADVANDLPKGWSAAIVGQLGEIITGSTPPKSDRENYGDYLPFVKPPELMNCVIAAAEDGLSKIGSERARVLPANSILVSCIGNLGKIALNSIPVAFNQQINAIVPFEGVNPKFVFYQVQSVQFSKQLEELASATTIAIVNKGKFEGIKCNLAPLNEQARIVAKI